MQLSPMRFATIEGTIVTAKVNSAEEAKLAVKELRHKKRELAHLKRSLLMQKRGLEARAARSKPGRTKRGWLQRARTALWVVVTLPWAFGKASAMMDIPKIEREIKRIDETLHNIDAVILQIDGRLLAHS